MSLKSDPGPELTQLFLALLQGKNDSLEFAPELKLILKTNQGKYWKRRGKLTRAVQSLAFLYEEERAGDRVRYYRTLLDGKPAFAAITLTAEGKVVSYGVSKPL